MSGNNNIQRPIIAWLILVYDRNAETRFPLKRKWYRFNYEKATEAEIAEVLRLASREDEIDLPPEPPLEVGKGSLSFRLSASDNGRSQEVLRFRHLFEYVPDESQVFSQAEAHGGFMMVGPSADSYFEDECGKPITKIEMMDAEARRNGGPNAFAIVHDEPGSILRLGPAEPIRPELWRKDDAALVAHFLGVYRQLVESRWRASDCVVSPSHSGGYKAILPVPEDCTAVILPFRQLYSKNSADDLFNRCCKIHSRHCPKGHPAFFWVQQYRKEFNAFLQSPPTFPMSAVGISAQRYLDAFAYGASVVHVSSKTDTPAVDLDSLLQSRPRELVVMGYHYILQQLMRFVSMAVPVIRQDVSHWIRDLGWPAEMRTGAQDLFGGRLGK